MIKTHFSCDFLVWEHKQPIKITKPFWFTFWTSAMINLLNCHTDERAGSEVTFPVQLWAFFVGGTCVLPLCPAASDSGVQSSLGELLVWMFYTQNVFYPAVTGKVLSNLPSSPVLAQLLCCKCDLWLFWLGLLHWDYLLFASFITCTNIEFSRPIQLRYFANDNLCF